MSEKKIAIVTGGAGFIGSHLVELLINNGLEVRVLDNFYTGRLESLAPVASSPNLSVHKVDVSDYETIKPLFEGADWVFHLAAMADIVPSIQQPMPYHKSNVDGTIAVLEAAKEAKVKRFMYAASSSCYGIPDTYPTPETAEIAPQYPYALTKRVGEEYVMHWSQVYKIPAISLRLFNVFGPRHRTTGAYGAVFGVFLAQKIAGEPFTIVGDGTQTRDFTYVTDVADAFYTAAQSDISGEIFNVGSGNTYSVNELIALLDGPSIHIPKRPGEPDCTFAEISKIKEQLNWSPKVDLKQGVAEMLVHIDDWKDAPVWTPDKIQVATADWFKYLGDDK